MKIKRVSDGTARSFRMRICHISDTHGSFFPLFGRYDVVLHTGDFFPNSRACRLPDKASEISFQYHWLKDNIANLKQQLQGHPFLYVPGNHDFVHDELIEHTLRAEGIEALGLSNKITTFRGVNFYGFPYVPAIDGTWNYERGIPEMQQEVDKMVEELNKSTTVDVLACHSPPYECLDLTLGNDKMGSTIIANALDYKIDRDKLPSVYLTGHCHEAHGMANRNGILVSNAATTKHIVEMK